MPQPEDQNTSFGLLYYLCLTCCHGFSFAAPGGSIEDTQRALKNHLAISEHEGDIRKYRASYNVYIRSSTGPRESPDQLRDPSRFIGRVGVKDCQEYGAPFPDNLTIPDDVLEKEKILKLEVGYAFLSKAWGKGYAPEALKAFVDTYLKRSDFWSPPFERVYLHGVIGETNSRSRRVLERTGFKFNGIHRWDGPDVYIGGAMQPPEVCVFSLGPLTGIHSELQSNDNP
jgi:RimJ/RimL family protein N-acetyltransferase